MPRVRRELQDAADELARRDPVLAECIEAVGPPRLRPPRPRAERFAALARAVCYQQLAGRAAAAIHGRFAALFDGPPTAAAVLDLPEEALRAVGLSGAKTASIRDLAARTLVGEVELDRMGRLPDERVIEELTLVRGIGEWTAQMFLMFELGRLDVWPTGDYGVRNGWAVLQGLPALPSPRELAPVGDPFRPYRSVVAWYCWRAVDTLTP